MKAVPFGAAGLGQQLKDQIARLKRDSSTSSKPPSGDIVKPKKKDTRRGRRKPRIGGQEGHSRQERIPFGEKDIEETIVYELSGEQAQGLMALDEWLVLQQVDLADRLYVVTEHRARKYLNPRTGRTVIAPLPEAVRAADLVGPKLSALAAYQKGDGHMSYSTIQRFWTNNPTEQALRHIVIDRHITQGTRGQRGQRWCERLWTVLATCRQQKRRVFEFFCNAIDAHFRRETVPSLLP